MGRELSLLSVVDGNPLSMLELRRVLRWRAETLQRCVESLRRQGFIHVWKESGGRGRPRSMVTTTSLGAYYLERIRELERLRLKLADVDIKRTVEEAVRTRELAELGRSPYETFWELTELAWAIRHAKEGSENT